MSRSSQRDTFTLNTSIRLFRKKNVLNTSRRLLQKSINHSICAASLKSNNVSLAKRVAELQMEVAAERTAKLNAQAEACSLRVELSQARAQLELLDHLKQNHLKLREVIVSLFDAGMAVMRSLNELPTSVSDTLGMTQMGITVVDPVCQNQTRISIPADVTTTTISMSNLCPMVTVRRHGDTVPNTSITIQNEHSNTLSTTPSSPVPTFPEAAVLVQLTPPEAYPTNPLETDNKQQTEQLPADNREHPHDTAQGPPLPSPIPPASPLTLKRPVLRSPRSIPSATHYHLPSEIQKPERPMSSRTHLPRNAKAKAKPIIDEPSTMLSPDQKFPAKSKRRRLVHLSDSDDESENFVQPDVFEKPSLPVQPRVVGAHINRPGQVVFRAEAKNTTAASNIQSKKPKTIKTRSKRKTVVNPTTTKQTSIPKSVFDLSANQTADMSVLPATLDELRQKQLSKKQVIVHPLDHTHKSPVSLKSCQRESVQHMTTGKNNACSNLSPVEKENVDPLPLEIINPSTRRLSVQVTAISPEQYGIKTDSATNFTHQPKPRYRRLYLNDNDNDDDADAAATKALNTVRKKTLRASTRK